MAGRLKTAKALQAAVAAAPPPQGGAAAIQAWRWLGPSEITNGQTYGDNGETRVVVSGRISAIALDQSNPNNLLIGAAAGGVWQSLDGGSNWRPRTDDQPSLASGALAFDPSNPKLVYCGTGEGDSYYSQGAGILKSTDGGATWTALPDERFSGIGFFHLWIDPRNGSHLLGATTAGIFESTDGGNSWKNARDNDQICWSVSIAEVAGETEALAASSDGLWVRTSNDPGWKAIALDGVQSNIGRLAVAHAPSDGRIAYCFGAADPQISVPDSPGQTMAAPYLLRRSPGDDFVQIPLPSDLSTTQCDYDWYLAVAPDSPNRIYIGAIDLYRGDYDGANWTWTNLSTKNVGDSIHPDQHAIAFAPNDPNTIYAACDGGIFRSLDMGVHWSSLNVGLGITEIEYFAQDTTKGKWLLAGTQDNGTIRYTGTTVWEHVADGDGGYCYVDQSSPNTVFHTFYYVSLERSTSLGDYNTFHDVSPRTGSDYFCEWYPPMTGCKSTIAIAGESIFVSRDDGPPWTEIALPWPPSTSLSQDATVLYVPTPDVIYVGAYVREHINNELVISDSRIFRCRWNGAAWKLPVEELPKISGCIITDLLVVGEPPSYVWVTANDSDSNRGRVYLLAPDSKSWIDKTPTELATFINAVEVDPRDSKRVWIATDWGVWQSPDAGNNWNSLGTGLPNALVEELLFNPAGSVLRAGTRSRGVWEISV
jgi:photosystem II stability/assembly factor-like uncharacterized protein